MLQSYGAAQFFILVRAYFRGVKGLPPNVHGSRRFIVKVQAQRPPTPALIYDEKRSFQAYAAMDQGQAYTDLVQAVLRTGIPKAFFWAVREGEGSLRIFTEGMPDQRITW